MDEPEGIVLSKIKSEKDKYCMNSLICGFKKNQNEQTKQTETDS